MVAAHLFDREIACERYLPVAVISDRQRTENRLAKTGCQPSLNVQRAIVKPIEFVLIAKHRRKVHLAFDKGKSSP